VLGLVATYARAHPEAQVIVGQGWDEGSWADQRRPSREELERAGGGAAVYLARVDVHSAVVSTSLLGQLPDIRGEAGYSDSGWVTQDAHHRCRSLMDSLFSDAERRAAARAALHRAAQVGIGSVHELGGPHLGPVEDLRRIADVAAELGIDVVSYWGELAGDGSIATAARVGAAGLAGDLCVDGAIGSRTAALRQPYRDAATRGRRYLSDGDIVDHLLRCTRDGLQAGFHCIGDDAVSATVAGLRAVAAELGAGPVRTARHRLEHVEMLAPDDLSVLSELGVVASMQPAFDATWGGPGELYDLRLGQARSTGMNRLGSLHRARVPLAFGSDSPVTPLAGWETVRAAVQHHQPDERMNPWAAFDAATRGGHWAAHDDAAGTLSVGSRASFAVWESDPDELRSVELGGLPTLDPGAALPSCAVTVATGRVVHHSGALSLGPAPAHPAG
jgi:predicted amidohydrolase YtcJ